MREEKRLRGKKILHPEKDELGVKVMGSQTFLAPRKIHQKRGRKSNSVALKELGFMLINSSKMKALCSPTINRS